MKGTDHFKRTIQMFLEQEQRKMNYSPKATATQPRT